MRLRSVLIFFSLWISTIAVVNAKSARFRAMWHEDPATTIVIGWDQVSGNDPVLMYDTKDYGNNLSGYRFSKKPTKIKQAKGMNNHFVRLSGLQPNTTYFFLIRDNEGHSRRYSFQTISDQADAPLAIIAGGDSRNHRDARCQANRFVAKLRPHFILFSGDMTDGDQSKEWIEWFDDWQLTFGSDGRIFPVVATRGNHEATNQTLVDLFDVPHPEVYYDLSFGGNLLKVYTLNTNIPSSGDQKVWLAKDLEISQSFVWRFAQYHAAIRPHSKRKPEKTNLILDWATLFHKYQVQLVIESDAHVVKWTYPIRPSRDAGSQEGFIRDDQAGTVYIGEGCWGAPLREADDPKIWTRDFDSFNQFKWIFVDQEKIEIRTLKTDMVDAVREISHYNPFEMPVGIEQAVWKPQNGSVLRIKNPNYVPPPVTYSPTERADPTVNTDVKRLTPDPATGNLRLSYKLQNPSDVFIVLLDKNKKEINRYQISDQKPGDYQQSLNFTKISPGQYWIRIEAGGQTLANYYIEK